jgi:hypothetical protein
VNRPAALGLAACLSLVWSLASPAPLGDNTVRLAPSRLKLPQNIGPLRYQGQSRSSDRRLGRSYAFNASGISLSIYVYDHGIAHIPEGQDSVPLCLQYEGAKGEIERGGNYDNVRLRAETSRRVGFDAGSAVTREAVYEFERHGIAAVSVLWLLAADGHFVKLRLSLRAEIADELEEARTQILAAVAQAIGQRRRRAPQPPAAAATEEASIEVDSHQDPQTAALWLTYALALVSHAREHPEVRPPCGGHLLPGYGAEMAARRAALAEYRARPEASRTSRYFDELMRIEEAGLLEEYVWQNLRNERWDHAAPVELRLEDYERFRAIELANHVVQSGARVRINTVRPLPPSEPVP